MANPITKDESGWLEKEANYFAMCLLMPKELIHNEVERFKKWNTKAGLGRYLTEDDIRWMARKFKVTDIIMTIRLVQLKEILL